MNPTEAKIDALEREKLVLAEKHAELGQSKSAYQKWFELAFKILSNPQKLWINGPIAAQQIVLRLLFADHLRYDRKSGFQTPQKSCISRLWRGLVAERN